VYLGGTEWTVGWIVGRPAWSAAWSCDYFFKGVGHRSLRASAEFGLWSMVGFVCLSVLGHVLVVDVRRSGDLSAARPCTAPAWAGAVSGPSITSVSAKACRCPEWPK